MAAMRSTPPPIHCRCFWSKLDCHHIRATELCAYAVWRLKDLRFAALLFLSTGIGQDNVLKLFASM